MSPLDHAILRTVLYADVFDFPLTVEEIHHYLIHTETVSVDEVRASLTNSPLLCETLTHAAPYYALHNRATLITLRQKRDTHVERLLTAARTCGTWLARLPFVRMVALTGSLAVRNPRGEVDDLDYFLLVEPGRVWLARAFAIVLVRLGRLRGLEICPNYVLASDQLTQKRQDLFIAREISQMIPLYGVTWYDAFRQANTWADGYQANALGPLYDEVEIRPGRWQLLKHFGEWVLGGGLGARLEQLEYQRKQRRFQAKMAEHADENGAEIDTGRVKGHFADYGAHALAQYRQRLAAYGVADVENKTAGPVSTPNPAVVTRLHA